MAHHHEKEKYDFDLGEVYNIKKTRILFGSSMTPAIVLYNPKYSHNVGGAVRATSNFGGKAVIFTGSRVSLESKKGKGKQRLPREERMKDYRDILLLNDDYPLNRFDKSIIPVAVEIGSGFEVLPTFVHPERAVYVFGPEDGDVPKSFLLHCHRFVSIPSKHCLNLAAAINVVLYDRVQKMGILTRDEITEI